VSAAEQSAAAALQYLAGRGDENAAESFCCTLWLPHLGQTDLPSRASMRQAISNSVPHCLHVKSQATMVASR